MAGSLQNLESVGYKRNGLSNVSKWCSVRSPQARRKHYERHKLTKDFYGTDMSDLR
jgi:hypothetical protein